MSTGKVKWFDESKGFGLITPEAGGGDVFVHFTAILGEGKVSLNEGDVVEYDVIYGDKGTQAAKIVKIS